MTIMIMIKRNVPTAMPTMNGHSSMAPPPEDVLSSMVGGRVTVVILSTTDTVKDGVSTPPPDLGVGNKVVACGNVLESLLFDRLLEVDIVTGP